MDGGRAWRVTAPPVGEVPPAWDRAPEPQDQRSLSLPSAGLLGLDEGGAAEDGLLDSLMMGDSPVAVVADAAGCAGGKHVHFGLGDGRSFSSSSQALVRMKSVENAAKNGQNLGSMVRKFMEKRSKAKDPGKTVLPPARVAEDLKKTAAAGGGAGKSSNLAVLHRKLFQRGKPGDATPAKALTEVKSNTRTLAMVLRSERELLDQNKEYEAEILGLRSLLEDKEREVEKLKDLCLKQRQEIKALKDAILFPDVMNAQLQVLLEKQGSELKQAKQVIPTLQKQVTSLTGQLQCLAEGLAEVKADNYAVRSHVDGHGFSPRTPAYDHESNNFWEFSSGDQMTPGMPDDMFLKDMNPCLTPCFPKTKSKSCAGRS